MQELQMKVAMLEAEKLTQEVAKLAAEVTRINAIATKTNVDAAYAGMQAAGVATERPDIAPAGDAILKSAGWVDSTPGQPTPAGSAPPGAIRPAIPDPQQLAAQRDPRGGQVGANVGEHAGIGTAAIE